MRWAAVPGQRAQVMVFMKDIARPPAGGRNGAPSGVLHQIAPVRNEAAMAIGAETLGSSVVSDDSECCQR